MAIYTRAFDPILIDPKLFVDRQGKRDELLAMIKTALVNPGLHEGRFLITGERGVGKSALTRMVLRDVRAELGGEVAVVTVEGRSQPSRFRDVLRHALEGLRAELESIDTTRSGRGRTPRAIFKQIDLVITLCSYANATAKRIEETVSQFVGTTGINLKLTKYLYACFGVEERHAERDALELEQPMDLSLLTEAVCQILDAVRDIDQAVVLFIDDLDQVYGVDSARLAEAEAMFTHILRLRSCYVVVNLRDYYVTDKTTREYPDILRLDPLDPGAVRALLSRRIKSDALNQAALRPLMTPYIDRIAKMTGNPLAALSWCHWLVTRATPPDRHALGKALGAWARGRYYTVFDEAREVAALFANKPDGKIRHEVRRKDLLEALDGDEELLHLLELRAVVIPTDYRHRFKYTLNPELHFWLSD